ncbi:bifunctional DNA primase/polymerase [Allostreptomyces psammosilenae]|uniref:DNA primase/polymerase bifunctional N-terminal domain-containing protein n=1 Tax=Allostreptomyces psammosilenae TaxID=1892865 RepID=A0A853A850_9ACTN|nr:bifunctional DNA primase/polymerase [Allostreptomyces psammosilenae]NYI06612.1 hypothetical protein [Allostreptomyces psammosilenae]
MDIMLGSRRRSRASVCRSVAEYAGRLGWPVAPGTHLVRGGRAERCSCGRPDCALPGMHPADGPVPLPLREGASPMDVAAVWRAHPDAPVLVAAGHAFDVLDVPAAAGRQALVRMERMGTPLGPVLALPASPARVAPGQPGDAHAPRVLFFVAAGARSELPALLYRMGWDDAALDLRCLGQGDWIPVPSLPVGRGGDGGTGVHWLRPPNGPQARRPPQARLLLGILAYTCHRRRGPEPHRERHAERLTDRVAEGAPDRYASAGGHGWASA